MSEARKKPAPDVFLLALERINEVLARKGERGVRRDECLVFEDSVAGVEAGEYCLTLWLFSVQYYPISWHVKILRET